MPRPNLLRHLRLYTFVCRHHDLHRAVLLEELREDEPRGPSADDECLRANFNIDPVEAMDRAGCRLNERGFFIGNVVNFVNLAGIAVTGLQRVVRECLHTPYRREIQVEQW